MPNDEEAESGSPTEVALIIGHWDLVIHSPRCAPLAGRERWRRVAAGWSLVIGHWSFISA